MPTNIAKTHKQISPVWILVWAPAAQYLKDIPPPEEVLVARPINETGPIAVENLDQVLNELEQTE